MKRVHEAKHNAETMEQGHNQKITDQIIDATIKSLETKIIITQKENDLDQQHYNYNEAYNQ